MNRMGIISLNGTWSHCQAAHQQQTQVRMLLDVFFPQNPRETPTGMGRTPPPARHTAKPLPKVSITLPVAPNAHSH